MDANICDINHLDADVLLPPRKRLLAGFKKQTFDAAGGVVGASSDHPLALASSSSSAASLYPHSPSSPSPPPSPPSTQFQCSLGDLVSGHFNGHRNLSPEQIVDASRSAADTAVKAAEAARAAAQDKATTAAKAVLAAKEALALVASFSEDAITDDRVVDRERHIRKNKLKKHVQVQLLYKKHQPVEHRDKGDDEELARRLHRVMNSSPRISRNPSEGKGNKNKKLKASPTSADKGKVSNGRMVFDELLCAGGHEVAGQLESEEDNLTGEASTEDDKRMSRNGNGTRAQVEVEIDSGAESSQWRDKLKVSGDVMVSPGKKRGRLKMKKLPLSFCNARDQASPKESGAASSLSLQLKDRDTGIFATAGRRSGSSSSNGKAMFGLEISGVNGNGNVMSMERKS
ncbi:hypothetical protein LINPERPRIM_LOCUS281 [Linum perenne]